MDDTLKGNYERESLDEVVGELHANENNFITKKTEHKSPSQKIPKIVIGALSSLLGGLIGGVAISALKAPDIFTSPYLFYGGLMFPTALCTYVATGEKSTEALISASSATLGILLVMYLQRMI